ncbi:MAG: hypothetical protein GF334_07815 [Candidatus Altiarchaeales archaeon]|nr:hypothetical protein [Candidatus Altiarchaeales archaeon]
MQKKAEKKKESDPLEEIKKARIQQREAGQKARREGRKAGAFAGLSIGSLLTGLATTLAAQNAAQNQQIEGWTAAGITVAAVGLSVLGSSMATRGEKTHIQRKQENLKELDHLKGTEKGYWIKLQRRR